MMTVMVETRMKAMGEEKKAKKEEDMGINCLDTRIMVMWTKVSDTQGLNLCLKPAVIYKYLIRQLSRL